MFDDVMVVAWGEFGRTPRVNNSDGGRDHWPQVGHERFDNRLVRTIYPITNQT